MRTFITGGNVIMPDTIKKTTVIINDGIIENSDYTGNIPEFADIINAKNMYIAPGIVELHAHGGGGFDFVDATEYAFENIIQMHRNHGITTLLPTTVSCSNNSLYNIFMTYRKVSSKIRNVYLPGLHLEGPFISPNMKGAHNIRYIHAPTEYETDKLVDNAGDIIKMCTVAPEIDGMEYMAKKLKLHGITLSAGHSDATFQQIKTSLDMGFSHITHLHSNTPGIRKINQRVFAGVTESAYYFDDLNIELIGDGRHVPVPALLLALKIKGPDKINITTDAMRAAGTSVVESYLGEINPDNRVIIEDDVAKLPDRSYYAGSIATGDHMLKWLNHDCGVSLPDAFKMLSLTPSTVIGINNRKGSIENGKDADILLIDKKLSIKQVITKN